MNPHNLGIKDIAKLADVSIGTVDRVLHNRKGVSKRTRERVLEIIRETGYQKNIVASRLKLASSSKIKIAILIPEIISNWSYWKLPRLGIKKAVRELEELGISADFYYFHIHDSEAFLDHWAHIQATGYDGLVTVPFLEEASNDMLQYSQEAKFPIVFLDTERALNFTGNFIRQNAHNAGKVAGRLLHNLLGNLGEYIVIHLAKYKEIQINSFQREEGFRQFFKENFPEQIFQHTTLIVLEDEIDTLPAELNRFEDKKIGIFVTNARTFLVADLIHASRNIPTHIIGFDLNKKNVECMNRDCIQFLINQKPEYQGYSAIKGLYKFLTQEEEDELNVDIPVEIIIKENVGFHAKNLA